MPPLDDEDDDDGIEDELDELDDELDDELEDELDDELDDGMDGIDEDEGMDGDGMLLDCVDCMVVSHALNNTAVRPMPSTNRCCDIFIIVNSACHWQDDDFALIQNNILIRPFLRVIIAPELTHFQWLSRPLRSDRPEYRQPYAPGHTESGTPSRSSSQDSLH